MSRSDKYTAIAAVSPELVLVDPELGAIARALLPFPSDCLAPRRTLARPVEPVRKAAPVVADPLVVLAQPRDEPRRRRKPSVLAIVGGLFALLVIASPAVDLLPGVGAEPPRFADPEQQTTSAPARRQVEPATPTVPPSSARGTTPKSTAESKTTRSSTTGTPAKPKPATKEPRVTERRGAVARSSTVEPKNGATGVRLAWRPSKGADLYNVIFWGKGKRVKDLWVNTASVVVGGPASSESDTLPPGTYQWFAFPGYRSGKRVSYGALAGSGSVRLQRQS